MNTTHATNLKVGMVIDYTSWCGEIKGAEIIKVEPHRSGLMLQTTKGPILVGINQMVKVVR